MPGFSFVDPPEEKKVEILSKMGKSLRDRGMRLFVCCEKTVLEALPPDSNATASSCVPNHILARLRKRLETLYKSADFTHRAIAGLAELPESMQIKAEEVIHQLNANADDVPIKRKLFRGKGKETVFEIVFARKGRLYFRRTKDRKVDILAVGTKNTQEKDLVYLDRRV